jgi:hypothetical protein
MKAPFRSSLKNIDSDISSCLVIMPFETEFDTIYKKVLVPTIMMANLKPFREDEIFGEIEKAEIIWTDIIENKVIIADVTGRDPSVLFELGLAYAIGKRVIIITQHKEDIPFDIDAIPYSFVEKTTWGSLERQLFEIIKEVLNT